MAEQATIARRSDDNGMNIGPPGDNYSNWLNIAKNKIKQREKNHALTRLNAMKKLAPKSINDTLGQLKLGKYNGTVSYFVISENDVINKLLNEWDILKLNNWNGPIIDSKNGLIEYKEYELECFKYADNNKFCINHAFWDLVLNELWIYCGCIANEIFSNSLDIQLRETLNKCLSVCSLLDIIRATVQFHGDSKKKSLLLKETVVHNIKLQEIINSHMGTKLDIEKWKKTEDTKKVYKHCGISIQKEAMKCGKEFVKLYKIYKLRKHKEKKRKEEELKKKQQKEEDVKSQQIENGQNEIAVTPKIENEEKENKKTENNENKEIKKDIKKDDIVETVMDEKEEKEKEKEDIKNMNIGNDNKLETDNKQSPNVMKLAIIAAIIIVILAVLTQIIGRK